MYDYDGSLEGLQRLLDKHGVTKDECNLENYIGLTFWELSGVVREAIQRKEAKERKERHDRLQGN